MHSSRMQFQRKNSHNLTKKDTNIINKSLLESGKKKENGSIIMESGRKKEGIIKTGIHSRTPTETLGGYHLKNAQSTTALE